MPPSTKIGAVTVTGDANIEGNTIVGGEVRMTKKDGTEVVLTAELLSELLNAVR